MSVNGKKQIAIIKEKGRTEKRVVIIPCEVKRLTEAGFEVFVESGCGLGARFSDDDYAAASGKVVDTETAWKSSPFVVKLKAPQKSEYRFFRTDLHLCCFFHLENDPQLAEKLCRSKMTAYSYEFLETDSGIFPISIPQSEMSGKMAVIYGAYHLQSHMGGSGILLADTIGVAKPKVVVIGYGNAGSGAVKCALALGLEVVVIGTNPEKLRKFRAMIPSDVKTYINSKEVIEREVVNADLVIGTILVSTYNTPPMIDESIVIKMKPGSMIVDVTCGYGTGYLPTFHKFSNHMEPTYKVHGVLHCKIDSLPSSVKVTASQALSYQIAPYLIHIGNTVFGEIQNNRLVDSCKIVENGQILSKIVLDNFTLMNTENRNTAS